MTLQELYAKIGGNYERAVQIMKMDKLIGRYVLKFPKSNFGEILKTAGESLDPTALFESAHAMKGVCANLGFDGLSEAAGELTEEFRPGSSRQMTDDEVRSKIDEIGRMYEHTVSVIREYEQEQT